MKEELILTAIKKTDCRTISESFQLQGWDKPVKQFEQYFEYQSKGIRDVIVAKFKGEFAGYLTIRWESEYRFFKEKGIPEIVDFNVLKKYQRNGIGTCLMDEAERRIKTKAEYAGIGFGLYKDYGPAQILYINRGYTPDGNGITKNSIPLKKGETIIIDDSIVFCLIKKL